MQWLTMSKPIVSKRSSAVAILVLVPTPSVEATSTGLSMPFSADTSNSPPNAPMPKSTSGP